MGMFSYYSGYYFCVKFIELVGNSVGQYGIVGGIGNNYFGVVQAGWIAMVDRFQVFETEILYVRQSVYETVFNWKIDVKFNEGIWQFFVYIFKGMCCLEVIVIEEEVFYVIDNRGYFFFVELYIVFETVSSLYQCINHFVFVHMVSFLNKKPGWFSWISFWCVIKTLQELFL